jgi:hypothetical protein
MYCILIHSHAPTRRLLRDRLWSLGYVVVHEGDVISRLGILEEVPKYQAQFVVAEDPEPQLRRNIELDFDRDLPNVPIVWLPDGEWLEAYEKWFTNEVAEVTAYI